MVFASRAVDGPRGWDLVNKFRRNGEVGTRLAIGGQSGAGAGRLAIDVVAEGAESRARGGPPCTAAAAALRGIHVSKI